jgi:hypothetical protein
MEVAAIQVNRHSPTRRSSTLERVIGAIVAGDTFWTVFVGFGAGAVGLFIPCPRPIRNVW